MTGGGRWQCFSSQDARQEQYDHKQVINYLRKYLLVYLPWIVFTNAHGAISNMDLWLIYAAKWNLNIIGQQKHFQMMIWLTMSSKFLDVTSTGDVHRQGCLLLHTRHEVISHEHHKPNTFRAEAVWPKIKWNHIEQYKGAVIV